ncbi:beta-ribofuranosylaminobenzene 5'-phosphate synthase [Aporhodopirellula aestuarii]|uniref:Beta-ribofuranosylaminobenzene 5'-phosphate synthase n=1 Tax=Aporhodopirellula aestuarii TaxID=2950107 RepID=A0ABT0U1B6_9BACT|nr:beta-ribofuranosylaminobenzene 5'-phosphate synthase [Aporhodopirellula aestuarii]MCM2370566.1 beta-ribofuranosylaminobenzene 5'-phosphate synthase [Aporhodopirellula aestuarii]
MNESVRIITGARLHFGLLDIASPFGGCGVMIDQPETIVEARPSDCFEFSQVATSVDHLQRATAIAQRIGEQTHPSGALPPVHVSVKSIAPPHSGLGSGTQLSLAISEAILRTSRGVSTASGANGSAGDVLTVDRDLWLHAADRGRRSAVGTHGYLEGGFIVEGLESSRDADSLNALDLRLVLPEAWRVAILLPATPLPSDASVSGEQEQARFAALSAVPNDVRQSLVRFLTDALVPAIENGDFRSFCEATTAYNRSSGELFSDVQGGAYNGEETTRLIERLIETGFDGVGQSSWGPGVFVWHPDEASAEQFRCDWSGAQYNVLVARPKADGRQLETFIGGSS